MLNTARMGEWFELFVPRIWEGRTVDEIFRKEWEAPKKLIHHFRMEEKVMMNGKRVNWNEPLQSGTKLQLKLFEEEELHLTPTFHDIPILYEDDHVLIMNKPPFMSTHPNDTEAEKNTLVNAALFHMQANGEIRNIRQIHRLDKETSGAILFAKHALAGAILDRRLEKREIKRTYLAMVHGLLKTKKGTINEPIGRDRHHPTRRRVSISGQEAITHYEVIKQDRPQNITYVKCWLDTGRTHQIRVHFSYKGHPLIGDQLYGGKSIVKRQALHAAKLEFVHPFTMEKIECYAPFMDNPAIFVNIDLFKL